MSRRAAFSSPVAPGRNGAPRAFPWAPHPAEQDPATHARAGTSLRHWPGITSPTSPASLDALTQHERLHVAIHLGSAFASARTGPSTSPILPGQGSLVCKRQSYATPRLKPELELSGGRPRPVASPTIAASRTISSVDAISDRSASSSQPHCKSSLRYPALSRLSFRAPRIARFKRPLRRSPSPAACLCRTKAVITSPLPGNAPVLCPYRHAFPADAIDGRWLWMAWGTSTGDPLRHPTVRSVAVCN